MGDEAAEAQRGIDLKDRPTACRHVRRATLAPDVDIAVAVLLGGLESFAGTVPEWHHNGFMAALVQSPRKVFEEFHAVGVRRTIVLNDSAVVVMGFH
jgi:hypothetical protein